MRGRPKESRLSEHNLQQPPLPGQRLQTPDVTPAFLSTARFLASRVPSSPPGHFHRLQVTTAGKGSGVQQPFPEGTLEMRTL